MKPITIKKHCRRFIFAQRISISLFRTQLLMINVRQHSSLLYWNFMSCLCLRVNIVVIALCQTSNLTTKNKNTKMKSRKKLLNRVCVRRISILKFSIVRYTDHAVKFAWCWMSKILSLTINNDTIVTFFDNCVWMSYHQFAICISLYIFLFLSLYCRIEQYVKFEAKNKCFKKNFKIFAMFLYCTTVVNCFFFIFESSTKITCRQSLSFWIFVSNLFNFCNHSSSFLKFRLESNFFCCWNSMQNDFNNTFLKNLLTFFFVQSISLNHWVKAQLTKWLNE